MTCMKTKIKGIDYTSYFVRMNNKKRFYGACNEALMKIELVKNGPIAVSFVAYADLINYHDGVYHHTYLHDHSNYGKFNPFKFVTHGMSYLFFSRQ